MVEKHLSLIFISARKNAIAEKHKSEKMPIYYFERDCDVVYITQQKTHLKSAWRWGKPQL